MAVATQHEAHHHASRRVAVSVGALVVAACAAAAWVLWGDAIRRACMGDGACPVNLGTSTGKIEPVDPGAFATDNAPPLPEVRTPSATSLQATGSVEVR